MEPCNDLLYEYAVVRFVPNIEREEFINIGLVMMCKRQKWLKGRIITDNSRLEAMRTNIDIKALRHQCAMFENTSLPDAGLPVEERYRWLTAVKSSIIQISQSHPGIIATANGRQTASPDKISLLDKEFERLFSILVL